MKETITKSQPLDESEAVKHRVNINNTQATTRFQVAKSAHPTWVNKALRVARHVALSTLLLSGVNHAALAQALPTAQTIPLASTQFDKSLLTPVNHVLDKTLVRPYKNTPMNLGYVLHLEKVRMAIIQDDFLAGKISLQESRRRKEELDRVTKDLLDELDIRQRGSIYKDNSAKGRAERKEYSRKLQNMSLPERVFKWAAESLRSFIGGDEQEKKKLSDASVGVEKMSHMPLEMLAQQAQPQVQPFNQLIALSENPYQNLRQSFPSEQDHYQHNASEHQLAFISFDDVDPILKEVIALTQPSFQALSESSTLAEKKESIAAQVQSLMAFNKKASEQFSGKAHQLNAALSDLRGLGQSDMAKHNQNVIGGKGKVAGLLDPLGLSSTFVDLTASMLEEQSGRLIESERFNAPLNQLLTSIESDNLQAIDDVVEHQLDGVLSPSEIEIIKGYADALANEQADIKPADLHAATFSMN